MQIFAGKKFENPIRIIEAFDNESFIEAFSQIENLRKLSNRYLLGYIRYEAKDFFLGRKVKSEYPLLYFEVYDKFCHCRQEQSLDLAKHKERYLPLVICNSLSYQAYCDAIKQIKEEIACGNTYEVNYTYDYKIESDLDGFDLYNSILPRQTTSYNAYIKNKYEEILSFSPELFFELEGNKIKTKPMKGTVRRGETNEEDEKNIKFLQNDVKNRAENVMIVDLLRNDLGKIAKTGTITVDKLFEIETHKTLHQMTSEISAMLEDNTTLFDIFKAIFPCGSITGAPKISTMEIIDKVEEGKREVYCGAIGLITPEKTIFSVPIRTLQKKNHEDFFSCRVGGAVVWDSSAEEEWEETLTKIKFLNSDNDIKLVETILVKDGQMAYADEHFERMQNSAKDLGFEFDVKNMEHQINQDDANYILRVLLDSKGVFEFQKLPFELIKTNRATISKTPLQSFEKFLFHKTTYRPWYAEALEKIKKGEIFDELFFNEKGELTEGARSNIVLQIDGELFTPLVESGLLNGVLRQELLREKKIKEKKLYFADLKNAQRVFCINSVRGMVEVQYDFN